MDVLRLEPGLGVENLGHDPFVLVDGSGKVTGCRLLVFETGSSRMDALLVLKRLTASRSVPVVVIAPGADLGSNRSIELFSAGAIDVLPSMPVGQGGARLAWEERLLASVRTSTRALLPSTTLPRSVPHSTMPGSTSFPARARLEATVSALGSALPAKKLPTQLHFHPKQVILIGASTGGTEAIRDLLKQLPAEMPGICIVQHIPAAFSRPFADRLNSQCALAVREAVHGDIVRPGLALVAPGGKHMELHWIAAKNHHQVQLHEGPSEHHQRPAVDVLFRTAATAAGGFAICALLTGMGKDGALGMKAIKEAGGYSFAQDEKSCVVFGMPGAACELGVVDQVGNLEVIAQGLLRRIQRAKPQDPTARAPVGNALPPGARR